MSGVSSIWEGLATGGSSRGIPYIGADNTPLVDLNNLNWDYTNKRLHVATNGDLSGTDSINSYAQHDQFQLQSAVPASPWNSSLSAAHTVSSSRGTVALPTAIVSGDYIGGFLGWAYLPVLNPTYVPIAGSWIQARGVNAQGDIGGEFHIGTKGDGGIMVDWMFVDSAGAFRPVAAGGAAVLGKTGFGWGGVFLQYTASPGAGNQAINTVTGRGSIGAGTSTAVITNNKVTATSVVLVQLETLDATAIRLIVTCGAGSFTVTSNANATGQTNFSFVVIQN